MRANIRPQFRQIWWAGGVAILVCLALKVHAANGQAHRPPADQLAYYQTYPAVPQGSAKTHVQLLRDIDSRQRWFVTAPDDETILVLAREFDQILVGELLKPICGCGGNEHTEILKLPDVDARRIEAVVNERLAGMVDAPTVKADESKNQLIIMGTAEQIKNVKAFIQPCSAQILGTEDGEATAQRPKTFHFEFNNTPKSKVLDWLVEITGLPTLGENRMMTGSMTFKPEVGPDGRTKRYTVPEIIDELNAILAVSPGQKWMLVRREKSLGVYPADDPLPIDVIKEVSLHDLYSREFGKSEFVSVIYRLTRGDPERTAKAIKPFMSEFGQVVPVTEANQLTLVDSIGSLRKVVHKIEEFEKARGG